MYSHTVRVKYGIDTLNTIVESVFTIIQVYGNEPCDLVAPVGLHERLAALIAEADQCLGEPVLVHTARSVRALLPHVLFATQRHVALLAAEPSKKDRNNS